jgi:RNA polymerase sigma-70 factor (ECF subfamily)
VYIISSPHTPSEPGDEQPGQDAIRAQVGREAQAARLVELLGRSARGHEDAFAVLYDETVNRVHGVILRVLRAPDLASEVTQEVYVEIWRQSARYSPDKGGVLTWMTTIAHRRAVDKVRSASSETARDTKYATLENEPAFDRVWDVVERRMDTERVRKAMESLTEIQREAITLSYFGGYSQSQVASLLQLPLGTVKSRIRDGLIGLRDALGVAT